MLLTVDQILARLPEFGLAVETQAAWHKIESNRKAVYLSKTKKFVTAIHISGFTLEHPAVVPPPKKNGKVTGHIDVKHAGAEEALFLALVELAQGKEGNKFKPMTPEEREAKKTLASLQSKRETQKSNRKFMTPEQAEQVASSKADEIAAELADRRARIAELAANK